MLSLIRTSLCLCLLTAILSSSALAYFNDSSRRFDRHDRTLQSQSQNYCWSTTCSYNSYFEQVTCDAGAYVYQFTVTSDSFVNKLELTCSNGITICQGETSTTSSYPEHITSAAGFYTVDLYPGCIMDHMRIGGIDVGNTGYGSTAVSCSCPAGASIVGLVQNNYVNYYPSFASFGIVCDYNFCLKGQYYSNGQCILCPAGIDHVLF